MNIFKLAVLICVTMPYVYCGNSTSPSPRSDNENRVRKPLDFRSAEPELQKEITGRHFLLKTNDYADFRYDKEFEQISTNRFNTVYTVYNPRTGKPIHVVVCNYDSVTRLANVRVKFASKSVFAPEDIKYSIKLSRKMENLPYGIAGVSQTLLGEGIPHDLLVQFASENHSFLNVLELRVGNGEWYLLDSIL